MLLVQQIEIWTCCSTHLGLLRADTGLRAREGRGRGLLASLRRLSLRRTVSHCCFSKESARRHKGCRDCSSHCFHTGISAESIGGIRVIAVACACLSTAQRQAAEYHPESGLPSCRSVERRKGYLKWNSSSLRKGKFSTKPKSQSVCANSRQEPLGQDFTGSRANLSRTSYFSFRRDGFASGTSLNFS